MQCGKKATSFFLDFQKEFFWQGGYRSIEAGEKPVEHQSSICGRRRACPTTLITDNRKLITKRAAG
jgi:hypothetical protein